MLGTPKGPHARTDARRPESNDAMPFLGHPNIFAYLMLVLWVPIVLVTFRRLPPVKAGIWLLLGGVMFLPEWANFDPPLLPPMDKQTLGSVWVLVSVYLFAKPRLERARALRGVDALFVVVCVSNLVTAASNSDALAYGPVVIQGTVLYDGVANIVKDTLFLYLPFFLGRVLVRTEADIRTFFRILVTAGLVYSVLALFEVRMSPQLHRWIYGFHQMDFSMAIRMGGYRPMIFMRTGLAVAMFFLSAAIAAVALSRARLGPKWHPWYLSVVLVLCKSTGALAYAAVVLPLVAFARRNALRLAVLLALLVVSFPVMRATQLFPTETILDTFKSVGVSEERTLSLWFRFFNEDQLLARANERVWFGWGGYGRNRVFDEVTGEDLSVTDGDWIIQFGSRGAIGFAALYGMLVLPIFLAYRRVGRIADPRVRELVTALAVIAALNATDLLPNGLFHYLPYLYSGALLGVLQQQASAQAVRSRSAAKRAAVAQAA